jgi:hypothetical protein
MVGALYPATVQTEVRGTEMLKRTAGLLFS